MRVRNYNAWGCRDEDLMCFIRLQESGHVMARKAVLIGWEVAFSAHLFEFG
jgi:hypothetical protein